MRPAAKTRPLPAQDARVPAPQRVSSARVVAPKVRPDAPQSSSSAPTPSPEFAHPALSGHTKDGRSSDPVGAPAIEAELAQDAALVSERDSVVSAAGRHTVPQPADESRTPPVTDNAPEIDHQYSTLLTFVSLPYTAGVLAIASYRQILVTTLYC